MSRMGSRCARLASIALTTALLAGCRANLVRLDPREPVATPQPIELPFRDAVSIEVQFDSGRYADAKAHQMQLFDVLDRAAIFDRVLRNHRDSGTNLALQGRVDGHFESNGAANFFSWFLGPFIFAQTWHGTVHHYIARAELELVEIASGRKLGRYEAQVAYELSHRSGNPAQILGTALLVPGIVKGAINVNPRDTYRLLLYEAVYPELWRLIAAQMLADQGPRYYRIAQERRSRCGPHYDAPPVEGASWLGFVDCQSRSFSRLRNEYTPSGVKTVFADVNGKLEVYVVGDAIAGWRELLAAPLAAADAPPGDRPEVSAGVPEAGGPEGPPSGAGEGVEPGAAAPAPAEASAEREAAQGAAAEAEPDPHAEVEAAAERAETELEASLPAGETGPEGPGGE